MFYKLEFTGLSPGSFFVPFCFALTKRILPSNTLLAGSDIIHLIITRYNDLVRCWLLISPAFTEWQRKKCGSFHFFIPSSVFFSFYCPPSAGGSRQLTYACPDSFRLPAYGRPVIGVVNYSH